MNHSPPESIEKPEDGLQEVDVGHKMHLLVYQEKQELRSVLS